MTEFPVSGHASTAASPLSPDYVAIGHVTRDVVADGYTVGGTVTYAGLTAAALGLRVGIVTSAGPDIDLGFCLPGLQTRVHPAATTTTFENIYQDGHRDQWLRATASPLSAQVIPMSWRTAPIVHVAPLVGEIGPDVIEALLRSHFVAVTPQGWLRRWESDGFVRRQRWDDAETVLSHCHAAVLSIEDIDGDWTEAYRYAAIVPTLAVTRGADGCDVFHHGKRIHAAAFPTVEVDATGAGDVFAAAFFIHLAKTNEPIEAARYANCVASFAVERPGISGIPTARQVIERLAHNSRTVQTA